VTIPTPFPVRARTGLARRQLFELEDQPRCPRALRDGATDYLELVARWGGVHEAVAPILARALRATGMCRIVDLCAGGGGPWQPLLPALRAELGDDVTVCLTDLFPNRDASARLARSAGGRVTAWPDPVDARAVPSGLDGFRTLFTSFHHFPPGDATAILADAVRCRQGIAIFELTARRVRTAAMLAAGPLLALALAPFARPFRWSRLLYTYLLPAIPLVVLWDGVVSCLRSYTVPELRGLAEGAGGRGYTWEAGIRPVPRLPVPLTWLVGYPAPHR
jgi:hypothetical protein